jgi:hypothetical protein
MKKKTQEVTVRTIQSNIINLPGRPPFMLAQSLAEIYGVTVKQLNRAVKRNPKRFPEDFYFQLSQEEAEQIRSQLGAEFWCQSGTKIYAGEEKLLSAFTRSGANQLSTVLHSDIAIQRSIQIMRAFSSFEEQLLRDARAAERQAKAAERRSRLDWQANRQLCRDQRRETTDAIAVLIEYARSQGSTAPDQAFFMSYSKMVKHALFELSTKTSDNFRDILSVKQLQIVSVAESIVAEMIPEEIANGTPYKGPGGIYETIKARITRYAETVGRTPLLEHFSDAAEASA